MYIGQTRPVLLEHSNKGGVLHGFTDNYIRTEVIGQLDNFTISQLDNFTIGQLDNFTIGQLDNTIVPIRLGEWNEKADALMGEIVKL